MHLTTPEKIGAAAVAVGVVAAVVMANKSAAATPAGGTLTNTSNAAYWLFELTTPYNSTGTSNASMVAADLTKAGFIPSPAFQGGFQIEADPTTANGWVVIAQYAGQPPTTIAASGSTTLSTLAPTAGSTWNNSTVSSLPTPTPVTGLTAGQWYAFSVRTSFLQAAPNAMSALAVILTDWGFGATGGTAAAPNLLLTPAADLSATPDTWNVFAQYTGPAGATTAPSSITDQPPLAIFATVPTLLPATLTASGTAGGAPAAGTTAPPTTMPGGSRGW